VQEALRRAGFGKLTTDTLAQDSKFMLFNIGFGEYNKSGIAEKVNNSFRKVLGYGNNR